MGHDTSPGDLARVYCSHCKQITFFIAKGGPLAFTCPTCAHVIRLELVHDGKKWRIKDMQTTRRETNSHGPL